MNQVKAESMLMSELSETCHLLCSLLEMMAVLSKSLLSHTRQWAKRKLCAGVAGLLFPKPFAAHVLLLSVAKWNISTSALQLSWSYTCQSLAQFSSCMVEENEFHVVEKNKNTAGMRSRWWREIHRLRDEVFYNHPWRVGDKNIYSYFLSISLFYLCQIHMV